ncbi:MAG: ATP-binding protein [Saprospiraceae bacterium]|nr:ATP-binding protein [Saprospiraceae bacterium]
MEQIDKIYIRPGVGILQLLKNQNYKPWFALAEFIDNAIDSYLKFETQLKQVEGDNFKLKVIVEINTTDNRITIRDNAAGIPTEHYLRAFRAADAPYDRTGLIRVWYRYETSRLLVL